MEKFILFLETTWYLMYHFVPALILLGYVVYTFRTRIRNYFDRIAKIKENDFARRPWTNMVAMGAMAFLFLFWFSLSLTVTDSMYYVTLAETPFFVRIAT